MVCITSLLPLGKCGTAQQTDGTAIIRKESHSLLVSNIVRNRTAMVSTGQLHVAEEEGECKHLSWRMKVRTCRRIAEQLKENWGNLAFEGTINRGT